MLNTSNSNTESQTETNLIFPDVQGDTTSTLEVLGPHPEVQNA